MGHTANAVVGLIRCPEHGDFLVKCLTKHKKEVAA